MAKGKKWMVLVLGLFTLMCFVACQQSDVSVVGSGTTYVLINEMNDFPDDEYGDLIVDYINTKQLKDVFLSLGVDNDKIIVNNDTITDDTIIGSIDSIAPNLKADDIVIMYVGTHGSWIRNELDWNEKIYEKWNSIETTQKLMIVDCCSAEEFTKVFKDVKESGVTLAVTSEDELGWWGLEEEGLPIIGSVWVKGFIDGVNSEATDTNNDGYISITEAYEVANKASQDYMKNEVFVVPEFVEYWHSINQYPEKSEGYPNAVLHSNLDKEIMIRKLK